MKVLLVCAGNICRSPMAEALFRHHAAFHASLSDVEVTSAGVLGLDDCQASPAAITVMHEDYGLDLDRHRARGLDAVADADLILALDHRVLGRFRDRWPDRDAELLGTWAGFGDDEVIDPHGGTLDEHRHAARHIDRLVTAAVARLSRERSRFDLDAYLARIGHARPRRTDRNTLASLHERHVTTIAFENLDIQMGLPIRLELAHLQEKIVGHRRGGYCFEQNTIFLHALRALGFDVMACEARVHADSGRVLPRTHMTLVVTVQNQRYLCDVGFGADGPLAPVAWDGAEHTQSLWTYRLAPRGATYALQVRRDGTWHDLYVTTPEQRYPADFEMANWHTSTFPTSPFVTSLTAQRSTTDTRNILRNLTLTTIDARGTRTRDITRGDLLPLLRDVMGIDVPADARFRALDAGGASTSCA